MDRAPEVKTLRRKLGELAGYRRGAALQSALAAAHAAARPDAIGYLMIDGHMRAYFGTRDLQKTHVARLHMAARATAETWVADADGQPAMVITAAPSKSLAGEIERLLPQLRATVGAHRSATLIFDRGGWSPTLLKKIVDAEFDLICWRKGDFEPLVDTDFTEHSFTDCDIGVEHAYTLAETTTELDCGKHGGLSLRQIHKRGRDGSQHPLVTSRRDLPAAEIVWRLGGRWRHENYFRYGRTHFALDALDDYTDKPDDPTRLVPNPAKTDAAAAVTAAEHRLADAETVLADAISAAAGAAGRPDNHGSATVDPPPRSRPPTPGSTRPAPTAPTPPAGSRSPPCAPTRGCSTRKVGWPGGLAPPGSHRTERDSLPSLRSSHRNSANANVRTHRQCANSAGSCLTIPSHHACSGR